jgi:hypothetical protein
MHSWRDPSVKGWRTPARASVGRAIWFGVEGGGRATPKDETAGRTQALKVRLGPLCDVERPAAR